MSAEKFNLKRKFALVTGGSRGIGKAIALAFAEAGADVAVASLTQKKLEETAAEIRKLGRRSIAIQADTSKKADVERMTRRVLDEFGVIDILVNNAGIIIRGPILEFAEEDWDKLMDIDLKGYFLCAQAVSKVMAGQKKGNIINITSQYAYRVTPGFGVYAVAKAGIVMLTRALAQELSSYGVRVNAIGPGLIKTDFSKASWSNPDFLKKYEASMPLGRVGYTDDIIGSALLLASDASSYITGHTIVIDGGALA
jgi:NAD(P)-dependent dehydrogenase (short-subunit alcohol dehydrogenase family)